MKEELLINKYLAWMILFSNSDPLSFLTLRKTNSGETSLSSYVPLLNKEIGVVNSDIKTTFQLFFKIFDKTVEEYIKDKPDIKEKYEKQIKTTNIKNVSRKFEKENKYLLSALCDLERTMKEDEDIVEA